jgi:hypothetical protein
MTVRNQAVYNFQRKWLPDQRQWWFKADAEATMLYLAERYCGSMQHVQENSNVAPAMPAEKVEAYRTLHLLPSAPDEVVKAVYRALSKIHHPDMGGRTSDMQGINEAFERLTQWHC